MNAIYRLLLLGVLTLGSISGYTEIFAITSGQKQSIPEPVWKQKGRKWLLCDEKGKAMTSQIYERHGDWSQGITWVQLNKKFGFINKSGEEIISPVYDDVKVKFSEAGVIAQQNDKWGFLSWKGDTLIPFQYDFVGEVYQNGLIGVNAGGKQINTAGRISGGKWGYINTLGQVICPLKYDYIGANWKEGTAWVNLGGTINNEGSVSGGKFGMVDSTGTEVVPIDYDGEESARNAYKETLENIAWKKEGSQYVLYDKKSSKIISKAYDKHGRWKEDLTYIMSNQKYGYINKNGQEMIPPLYENVMTTFSENGVMVKQNGKWGFLNWKKEVVIPFRYDMITNVYDNGLIAVNIGGKEIKDDGTIEGGKWGYINDKGQVITPLLYDYVGSNWKDGVVWINQGGSLNRQDRSVSGGKFGLIDHAGAEVVPPLFEEEASARQAFHKGIGNQFQIEDTIPDIIWNY